MNSNWKSAQPAEAISPLRARASLPPGSAPSLGLRKIAPCLAVRAGNFIGGQIKNFEVRPAQTGHPRESQSIDPLRHDESVPIRLIARLLSISSSARR